MIPPIDAAIADRDSAETTVDRGTRRIFGSPAFFRLWLAQVVSATGDWLGLMAITALAAAVSLVLVAIAPFAGGAAIRAAREG